jgi:hypothetical protein
MFLTIKDMYCGWNCCAKEIFPKNYSSSSELWCSQSTHWKEYHNCSIARIMHSLQSWHILPLELNRVKLAYRKILKLCSTPVVTSKYHKWCITYYIIYYRHLTSISVCVMQQQCGICTSLHIKSYCKQCVIYQYTQPHVQPLMHTQAMLSYCRHISVSLSGYFL